METPMTALNKHAELRKELSNPAIGSKDHLRKLALTLLDDLEAKEKQRANWCLMAQKLGDSLDVSEKRVAELDLIRAAAEKLVRCKGRYHSEQNYRALAKLFGVTTPDLPPLDEESRTVTVKLPDDSGDSAESSRNQPGLVLADNNGEVQ
jgi:hypothetical protein